MPSRDARPPNWVRALATLVVFALGAGLVAVPAAAAPAGTIRLKKLAGATLPGSGNGAVDLAIEDLDGDLDYDVALITAGSQRIMTFLNDGDGGYTLAENYLPTQVPTSIAVADFDSDGKKDIAWGDQTSATIVAYGDGTGRLDTGRIWFSTLPQGTGPIADLEVSDVDANGWPDLVHVERVVDTLRVISSIGFGTVITSYAMPPGTNPIRIATGYVDAGWTRDVAVIGSNGGLSLYTNDGTGAMTKTASSPLPTGPMPSGVTMGWFDADDPQDIAVCDFAQDNVRVYYSASGHSSKTFPTGDQPMGIATENLGTGAWTDLAVACENDNTVAFLEGDESGGFTDAGTVPISSPTAVAFGMADFDYKHDVFALTSDGLEVWANQSPPLTRRFAGADRYETAVEISKRSWGGGADTVVIATGELYPDALAGTPLAFALQASILLTRRDALPPSVATEIGRLGAKKAIILGGEGAVSAAVREEIVAAGIPPGDVTRIGGDDRYGTAHLIAVALQDAIPGTDVQTAFVATGEDFPDALAGGAFAAIEYGPIVLVRRDSIPDESARILADLPSITDTYVLGGTGVVSEGIAATYPNPTRLAGADRYGTSRAIAEEVFASQIAATRRHPMAMAVATGELFPDALSIGPFVALGSGPVVLTRSESLPPDTHAVISGHAKHLFSVDVAGGTGAVSEAVVDEMEAAY